MRQWFLNLKWIRAICEYDELVAGRGPLLTEIRKLREEIVSLNNALDAKEAMAKMASAISDRFNAEMRANFSPARIVDGQKMSKLTYHEEKLIKMELDILRKKVKDLEDTGVIPRTIHGTENSSRTSL